MTKEEKKRFIILDSNSIIHRAFHALPPLTTKRGEPVSAIYGFLLVFLKAIREIKPDFIVACFDFPGKTFRHQQFKEYKINRPPTPKELPSQIKRIKEVLKFFNVPIFEKEGFEADDLIGTLSWKLSHSDFFKKENLEIIIVSGDLDTLQLVDKNTKVFLLNKGVKGIVFYDEETVQRRYQGISPNQLVDFKALKGDPSDNIPGIRGIGEKTAIFLIREFGNLEILYQALEEKNKEVEKIKPRLKKILIEQKDQVFFSKRLAEIKRDVPLEFNLKDCQWGEYDKEKIIQSLKDLEFYSLLERIPPTKKELKIEKKLKLL